jgi:pentafunctional AROM polypeptide
VCIVILFSFCMFMTLAVGSASFRELNPPHRCLLLETSSMESIVDAIRAPDFGGASVTSPHRQAVLLLMDELTEHARALLGTVDTIMPATETLVDGTTTTKLVGDNTYWKAIVRCIQEVRTSQHPHNTAESALVLGAGRAARAALYVPQRLNVPKKSIW